MAGEGEGGDLGVGDFDAFGIFVFIQFGAHFEAGLGRRCCDELDDDLMADERFATPVSSDEREQAMLDLVPFAGAGRQVTYGDGKAKFVGQLL